MTNKKSSVEKKSKALSSNKSIFDFFYSTDIIGTCLLWTVLLVAFIIPVAWSRQINANYHNAKLFLFYFISGLSVLTLAFRLYQTKSLISPVFHPSKIDQKIPLFFVAILFLNIVYGLIFVPYHSFLYAFKTLGLIALAYFFYYEKISFEKVTQRFHWAILGLVGVMLYFPLENIYQRRFVEGQIASIKILGSFGNVNMLAEFFALAFPILFEWARCQNKIPKFLKQLALGLWIFVILYTQSRSAWLGLFLWFFYALLRKTSWRDLLCFAIGGLLHVAVILTSTESRFLNSSKTSSSTERWHLYSSALELALDKPLGVGQRFMNEIIPYKAFESHPFSEYEYVDHPHSEFLKWADIYGFLGLFLYASLLFLIGFNIYKSKKFILSGAYIILIPQMIFQFPLENPATMTLLALYLGNWLLQQQQKKLSLTSVKNSGLIALFIMFAVIMISNSILFIQSVLTQSQHASDAERSQFYCDLYPLDMRNCENANVQYLQTKNIKAYKENVLRHFEFTSFNPTQQRIAASMFSELKKEQPLCEMLLIYKRTYSRQEHFEQQTMNFCEQKYRLPFSFNTPSQFHDDYQKWFKNQIENL